MEILQRYHGTCCRGKRSVFVERENEEEEIRCSNPGFTGECTYQGNSHRVLFTMGVEDGEVEEESSIIAKFGH